MSNIAALFSLHGKVAFVTGASGGLGRAMALGLSQAGATVVIAGRNIARLQATHDAVEAQGGKAHSMAFDMQDYAAAAQAIADTATRHGRLDILVNNAGLNLRGPLLDSTVDEWNTVMNTNMTATYVLTREALRPMVANGWGRIINIGSALSVIGRQRIASYVASKHAVAGFTKAVAAEFGRSGITCNCLAPGYFNTEINDTLTSVGGVTANIMGRIAMRRWGDPHELAGVAVFLASDASSYVTGHVLLADGGLTAAFALPETE